MLHIENPKNLTIDFHYYAIISVIILSFSRYLNLPGLNLIEIANLNTMNMM
jgi:hypothetical protein